MPVYDVQGYYGTEYGWETVTSEETKTEALQRLKEYNEAEPNCLHRVIWNRGGN